MAKNKSHVCCTLFTLFIFNVFFLILSIPCSSICQEDDSLYYTNPDYHIAKELFIRRIVMLGDNDHSHPGPYHNVLNTLDNWLRICVMKNKDVHLTLTLETEKEKTDELNNYIMTGDMGTLIDTFAPGFFLEDLEFYTQLRNFSRRIDSINNSRTNKYFFTVKGFEEVGRINFEKQALRSQKESELWFVKERDSTTAMGIINYVNSKPDEQILIFYGIAHLVDGFYNKNEGFKDLTQEESMGYFLVHYLKKEFGNEKVISFMPRYYWDKGSDDPDFEELKTKDILFKGKYLKNDDMKNRLDFIVSYHCQHKPIIQMNYICSRYILEKTHQDMNRVKDWLPGYKAMSFCNRYLNAINYLTGMKFNDYEEFNEWYNKNNYDGLEWLYSDKLADSIMAFIGRNPQDNFIKSILGNYGVDFDTNDAPSIEDWRENVFPQIYKLIKFTNSIGIYWFGYPDEKIKAKEYLKEFSEEDYQEPEKYLQWYRMKYYGYEY